MSSSSSNITSSCSSSSSARKDAFLLKLYDYLCLARLQRPVPIFLLVFPAFWSVTAAIIAEDTPNIVNAIYVYLAILMGGVLARSAGCVINDIADRKIDYQVERTKNRPLASGRISVVYAIIFAAALGLSALLVLNTLNNFTKLLGAFSIILIVCYPFVKRITYYPQVFLGLTFGYGALMGEAALHGHLSFNSVILYLVSIFWVIGYDSIYAIQDYREDLKVGIKSIPVVQGASLASFVGYCYSVSFILLLILGYCAHYGIVYFLLIILVGLHFVWQVVNTNVDRPDVAGVIFNYNFYVGLLVLLAIAIH